ncbi:MAG TPA: lysine biosynthesis protein [Clostridia bacterium]|nr:lysine biosynthesis protein [Clostridia bacterium]
MRNVLCPVCGLEFEVPEDKGPGDKVICPWCSAELVLAISGGALVAKEI